VPLLERAKLLLSYFLDCGSAKLVLLSICFSRVVYMVLLILPIGLCQLVFLVPLPYKHASNLCFWVL